MVLVVSGEVVDDFSVEVEASEETVRAGQPFNVTCVAPIGRSLQQQWLHPKIQARFHTALHFPRFLPPQSFMHNQLQIQPACAISLNHLSCFNVISYPAAPKLKLANNGFGRSRGKWNIALRRPSAVTKYALGRQSEICVFITTMSAKQRLPQLTPWRTGWWESLRAGQMA